MGNFHPARYTTHRERPVSALSLLEEMRGGYHVGEIDVPDIPEHALRPDTMYRCRARLQRPFGRGYRELSVKGKDLASRLFSAQFDNDLLEPALVLALDLHSDAQAWIDLQDKHAALDRLKEEWIFLAPYGEWHVMRLGAALHQRNASAYRRQVWIKKTLEAEEARANA